MCIRDRVSAVLNEDHVPSEFLYGYLPEWFDRDRDGHFWIFITVLILICPIR